jgi:hypothetical protein
MDYLRVSSKSDNYTNHMTSMLCLLSLVDNKLFSNNSKQSAYSQQRSRVIMQLWIMFILYVTALRHVLIHIMMACGNTLYILPRKWQVLP